MPGSPCQNGGNVVVVENAPIHQAAPFVTMPTLFRFLIVVGIIAGMVYAGIAALATLVKPEPREISVTVPQDRFHKQR